MVTDLDMLKQILVKDFNNFIDRTVSLYYWCELWKWFLHIMDYLAIVHNQAPSLDLVLKHIWKITIYIVLSFHEWIM